MCDFISSVSSLPRVWHSRASYIYYIINHIFNIFYWSDLYFGSKSIRQMPPSTQNVDVADFFSGGRSIHNAFRPRPSRSMIVWSASNLICVIGFKLNNVLTFQFDQSFRMELAIYTLWQRIIFPKAPKTIVRHELNNHPNYHPNYDHLMITLVVSRKSKGPTMRLRIGVTRTTSRVCQEPQY